jgi:DNA polymerase elongation subunit (family B)
MKKKRFLSTVDFFRGNSQEENCIIYTFSENGEKKMGVVRDPKITFYVDKEDVKRNGREMYVPIDEVDRVTCSYRDLIRVMAQLSDNEVALNVAYKQGNVGAFIRQLNQLKQFHGTDVDISDHYISKLIRKWKEDDILDETPKLHKAFGDIEVDLYHQPLDFSLSKDDTGPVDLASVYDSRANIMYTFALDGEDNTDNKQIKDFRKNEEQYKRELIRRHNFNDIVIKWFDDDGDLIVEYFRQINTIKPDFMLYWNIMFDVPYMMRRLVRLGYNPEDVMCPEEFPRKKVFVYEDKMGSNDLSKRGDYVEIAGYTNFADQMLQYAGFRATKKKLDNYKLDTVGMVEVSEGKDELDITIRNVSRHNYKQYFFYHIQDVKLMDKIEAKTKDFDLLYQIAVIAKTRPSKAWRKTISLRNLAAEYMEGRGDYVVSNNHNINNEMSEKFPGAFVHDITKNQNEGILLYGKRCNTIFDNVVDVDMGSLYPSILIAHMIDPKNQLGRFTLTKASMLQQDGGKEIFNNVNVDGNVLNFELGYKLSDDLVNGDWLKVGRWIGLKNQDDLVEQTL